jgi:hypothetical protein
MRIEADEGERELGHVRLSDYHAARSTKPAHHGCVGCGGRRGGEHLRAGARWLAGNIEQILDAQDRAVGRVEGAQWREITILWPILTRHPTQVAMHPG